MRILVKASCLWNGHSLQRDVDLTVENGYIYFGKKPGSYDNVLEAYTVLPGLIDTHVHLTYDTRPSFFKKSVSNVAKLFIAHGVLCIRDTGNYMGVSELFNSINNDLRVITTYTVEKPPLTWMFMRMIRGLEDIDRAIHTAKAEDCKWFKLYDNVNPEIAREAVVKAHEAGLKTTCHLTRIGLRNAIDYGFDAFEHLMSLPVIEPLPDERPRSGKNVLVEAWEKIDEGTIEELGKKMSSKGIAVSTTMSLLRSMIGRLRVDKRKFSKYVTPWYKFIKGRKVKDFEKVYAKSLKAIKILWSSGVKIIAGTDLPNEALNPGISLWEEIDILQEAGLDIWSALKTTTGYASEVLETEIGVVKEKSIANLLLINREVKSASDLVIKHVIIGDKIYNPNDLLKSLEKLRLFGV